MGELDSYDWWWNVALQGVAGSVLGALTAVLVLLLGLRFDRLFRARAETTRSVRELLARTRELRRLYEGAQVASSAEADTAHEFFRYAMNEFNWSFTRGSLLEYRLSYARIELETLIANVDVTHDYSPRGGTRDGLLATLATLESDLQRWVTDRRGFNAGVRRLKKRERRDAKAFDAALAPDDR